MKRYHKDKFFEDMARLHLALTFDDVRLKTGYSQVMPDAVSLETKFSRNVPLKIPITSAAMDTVTESDMAIELAKLGGIGVIHRGLSPQDQASEVGRVKYHLNALIETPITVTPEQTIESVLAMRSQRNFRFHTFPVIEGNTLVGIITANDLDFCDKPTSLVKDIMSTELLTASQGISVSEAYARMKTEKKKVLPVIDQNGLFCGMYVFSDVKRIVTGSQNMYNVDAKGRLRVAAAIGTGPEALERAELLLRRDVDVIVIDGAHGDTSSMMETLKEIKKRNIDVIIGNISEPDSAKRLLKAGADGIKVGQGPGSICTTRPIAGVGCPQVTAIYNCAKEAREFDVPVCGDGGLKYSGDIVIAIAAGADSVMMGSMLAGTKEAPGTLESFEGRQWKSYRGMGSLGAMEASGASRERYRQQATGKSQLVPEGVEGLVPYRGELSALMIQYVGGLRRGMGYVGAASIEELQQKADFHRVTNAGMQESHPHSVRMIREPPNYTRGQ